MLQRVGFRVWVHPKVSPPTTVSSLVKRAGVRRRVEPGRNILPRRHKPALQLKPHAEEPRPFGRPHQRRGDAANFILSGPDLLSYDWAAGVGSALA